ncbi:MAG: plasmid stabilization system protein ParE [Candidatus Endobugula sp.]|jgi:plasmid stabilization system protein ParE
MMEIVWAQEALERIEGIKHYLAKEQQAPTSGK